MFPADEQPFLAAIVARPADDEPRLVYADYLDETGVPRDAARAELIRVQIALHRLPGEDRRRATLAERENELLESHRPAWTAPLARLGAKFQFRRGLPDSVALDSAVFLAHGEELFDNTPVQPGRSFIAQVRLSDAARVLPALVACPLLNQIEELDLANCDLGNGGAALLVTSAFLKNVRALELGQNRLGDSGAISLARAATLPKLTALVLNDNAVGSDGVAALAESPFLAALLELDLSGNEVNEAGVRALVRGSAMHRLRRLRIADNPIRDGIADLANSALFERMTGTDSHLDLSHCGIEPSSAAALGTARALHGIEYLDLNENYIGDSGIAALLSFGNLAGLRTLRLVRNQIADVGAAALLSAKLPQLEHLDLSSNRLSHRGVELVKAAAQARNFTVVTTNNGTETMAALPPRPAARAELDQVVELRRGLTYPARPGVDRLEPVSAPEPRGG